MRLLELYGVVYLTLATAKWHCGTDKTTEFLSAAAVFLADENAIEDVNQCCGIHDHCYYNKEVRSLCDEIFCKCLHESFRKPYSGAAGQRNAETKKKLINDICDLVRDFGGKAYENKGENSYSFSAIWKWLKSRISKYKNKKVKET